VARRARVALPKLDRRRHGALSGGVWNSRSRAARAFAEVVEGFEHDGFAVERKGLTADLRRDGGPALHLRIAQQGRIFGGSFALELSTAEPVLPATRGLRGRGRGVVKLDGVDFRSRGHDEAGRLLGARLERDERLQARLREVHFERIRVEPDGRPVIRHMGGSVVWVLFPPFVKAVPLVPEQRRAAVTALEAFASVD
jgi:Protein of unknown function (DUF3156)